MSAARPGSGQGAPRLLLPVVLMALVAAGVAWSLLRALPEAERRPGAGPAAERIVSLTPAITETLFALGAGDRVVARSDYCSAPPQARGLPAVGTSLTPNLELIARMEPDLVLGEDNPGAARGQLAGLAPTVLLPWLTADEVLDGVRTLGRLTATRPAAAALARRLDAVLADEPPAGAPRVLLAMGHEPGQLGEVWFFKRNSIHGALLHAAGARNAVDEDVAGTPNLSLERVIELDPDVILVLVARDRLTVADRSRLMADWRAIEPLSAPRRGALAVHEGTWLYATGPRLVEVGELLRREIARLREPR